SLGLPDSLFGVAWPVIHIEFGIDQGFASLMTIIIGCGTIWTSIFAGKAIRKFGTGIITAFSVCFTAVGLIGISFSQNVWVMIVFCIILGIGAGAIDAALNDYVAKHYKPQHMNWLHCFWGIGVTTSPIIMSRFLKNADWRGGYQTIAIMQSVLVVIMFASLPLWKKVTNSFKLSESALNVVPTSETIKSKINPIKIKGVTLSMAGMAFYCGLEMTLGTWGASMLIETKGIAPSTAALWIALYYGGITVGRGLSGFLAMKLSDNTLIKGGLFAIIFGIVLLLLPFGQILTLIGLMLIGLGCAPIFPCTIHATATRFGFEYSADLVGYQMAAAYIGSGILQPLVGFISSRTTFLIMPYILLGFVLIQLLFFTLLKRKLAKV
ncbi:MAG: MFS transporter, partial [Clostridia bacterium]